MVSLFKQAQFVLNNTAKSVLTTSHRLVGKAPWTTWERRGPIPFPPRPHPKVEHDAHKAPRLPVHFTGSTYDTELKLKRPIKDLSMPIIWEANQECLKWTDWKMLKDVRRRHIVSEYWPLKQNLVCIKNNKLLPAPLREAAHQDIKSFPMWQSVSHVTNRCCLTSRGRGKYRAYRLSRIIWRHLADYNKLSGVMKAKWGFAISRDPEYQLKHLRPLHLQEPPKKIASFLRDTFEE